MGFFRRLAARIDRFYARTEGESSTDDADDASDSEAAGLSTTPAMSPSLLDYILTGAELASGERLDTPKKVKKLVGRLQKIRSAIGGTQETVLDLKNALCWIGTVRPDDAMFSQLYEQSLPELVRLLRTADDARDLDDEHESNVLRILNVLAGFQTEEATREVIRATLDGAFPEGLLWSDVLEKFFQDHPFRELYFDAIRNAVPSVRILDTLVAASVHAGREGFVFRSPFDSPLGAAQFRAWLSGDSEYLAIQATQDLASFQVEDPAELLELAARHHDSSVRISAAWSRAKRGDPAGRARLEEFARDPDPEIADYGRVMMYVLTGEPWAEEENA